MASQVSGENASKARGVIRRASLRPTQEQLITPERRAETLGKLCTLRDMANVLGVNWRTLYNWCDAGMPYVRLGGTRLFDPAKVRVWIQTR
jgi:hypothetical protein